MIEDWDRHDEERRRQDETLRRIHRLVKRGYLPDWSITDVEDAIWFEHPGHSARLILFGDGKLVACNQSAQLNPTAKEEWDRIYNETSKDPEVFDRWLSSVPLPTWKQRTATAREKYLWRPGCFIAFLAICILLGKAADAIWRFLTH